MSADERGHEDAPKKHDEPSVAQACLSWMRTLETPENSAPSEGSISDPLDTSEAPPDDNLKLDETLATLLRAIESTEIARHLGVVAQEENGQPQARSFAVWAETATDVKPPATSATRRKAAAKPASTFLVQTPPRTGSRRLMPPSDAPTRRRARGTRPKRVEPLPDGAAEVVPPVSAAAIQEPQSPALAQTSVPENATSASPIEMPPPAAPEPLVAPPKARSRRRTPAAAPHSTEAVPVVRARTVTPSPASFAQQPPAPAVRQIAAAANPNPGFLVQNSPQAPTAGLMPAAQPLLRRPVCSVPIETAEALLAAGAGGRPSSVPALVQKQPSPVIGRIAAAATPISTFLVQTPAHSPFTGLMPPADAPTRRPPSPAPLAMINSLPAAVAGQIPPRRLAAAPEPEAASAPSRAPALLIDSSPTVPTLRLRGDEFHRLANVIGEAMDRVSHAGGRLFSQPANTIGNWSGARAAVSMRGMSRTRTQLSSGLRNWLYCLPSYAALAMKRMSRVRGELTTGFENWIETKAAPSMQSLGRATWARSTALSDWVHTKAALSAETVHRAASKPSAALPSRVHSKPVRSRENIARAKTQPSAGVKNWFGPRRSSRLVEPPVVAYCWTADTPHSLKIADISASGLHLLTDLRWPRGATVPITLQRTDRAPDSPESWIVVDFTILRWCQDGLAGAMIPPTTYSVARGAENCADPRTLKRFVKRLAVSAHA